MKRRKILLFVFLVLAFIGIEYEFEQIYLMEYSVKEYGTLFYTIGLLLIYIIPIAVFITYISKKWKLKLYNVLVSLVAGIFIAGWLCSYGNEIADVFLNTSTENWGSEILATAFVTPVVEEGIKVACVIMVLRLLNLKDKKEYFISGITVGIGFQIIEDISYVAGTETSEMINDSLLRIATSISSHWMFTGILAVGIYCYINKNTKQSIKWIIFPIVLHGLWNSPLNYPYLDLQLPSAIIAAVIVYEFIKVYKFVNKDEVENKFKNITCIG